MRPPPTEDDAIGASVTWLGHASVLIELDGARILTDPVVRTRVGPLVRTVAPVAPEAIEGIDAVLLSHLHSDHSDVPSLRCIGRSVRVLAPHGAGRWLRARGMERVDEVREGQTRVVGPLRVSVTPAVHDARRWPVGGPRAQPVGFVVSGSSSVYFPGDTDLFARMAALRGGVDLALLPVWGWGPTAGRGHLDPERAARAAAIIAPGVAVPIHWGTLALPAPLRHRRDPEAPPRTFAARAARLAPEVEVRVLKPGARTELHPIRRMRPEPEPSESDTMGAP